MIQYIQLLLKNHIQNITIYNNEIFILIHPNSLIKIITILNKCSIFNFKILIDITVIDYPERLNRFEIIYQLLSLNYNTRINIKTISNENLMIESLNKIYNSSIYMEREIYDMFGIYISNHPDLRRILTDYGFNGHPLKKDFPLTGYLEIIYNDIQKRIQYVPLTLSQEYRVFDYTSS